MDHLQMLHLHGPRHGPQSVEAALLWQDPNTSPVHLSPAYLRGVIYGLTPFQNSVHILPQRWKTIRRPALRIGLSGIVN